MNLIQIIFSTILGALLWTLTEYVLHRFFGHLKLRYLVRSRFYKEHSKHHLVRDYFAGPRDKLLTVLVTAPKIMLASSWMAGVAIGGAFTFGFVVMYFTYELVHYRMHIKAPPHAYASKMRAHHFYHHYVDETMNHGVTTPLWDLVFGTYRKPATIVLSEKFKQRWFLTGADGIYRDNWGQVYQVAQATRA